MEKWLVEPVNANKSHLIHHLPLETNQSDKQKGEAKAKMVDFQENQVC
jgi:hypothetical protein